MNSKSNRLNKYSAKIVMMTALLSLVFFGQTANAAILWWDGNASTTNSASDNSSTTGMNWLSGGNWDDGNTSGSLGSWTAGNTAIFGGSPASQTVTAGTLTIGNLTFGGGPQGATSGSTPAYTISGGTLTLSGTTMTVNTPTTVSSTLAGAGASLTKSGSGSLILSGNNTYSGGTTISAGTLQVTYNTSSSAGTGTITLGDASTGTDNVQLNINHASVSNAVTVANQGTGTAKISYLPASGNFTASLGNLTLNRATTFSAPSLTGSGYMVISSVLSGSGTLTLGSLNGGRLILTGASPSYTGDIIVQNAAMLEPRDTLNATSGINVTVQTGGKMQIVYSDTSIGALNGSGYVQGRSDVSGLRTLTIGKGDNSGTFTGVIQNNGSATIALTKSGTGTETLGGTNTYTGATSVSNGTLAVTGSLGVTAVAVNSPATLAGNGNIGGNVTIASGGHHALAVAATTGAQVTRAITGTLALTSGNILDLTAASFPANGVYVLATATVNITGTPTTVNQTGIFGGTVSVDTASTPKRLLLTVVGPTVTYNGNGSTGGTAPVDGSSPYNMNATVTVPGAGSLTKTGNTFAGWNTQAGGGGTAYSAGSTFAIAANTTLYAQWTPASATITAPANFPGAVSTTYGTVSSATRVAVSGANLTADITDTAPGNLEVSSDGSAFGATATFAQTGGNASGTLSVRLRNNAPVTGSPYDSQIVFLTSLGATTVYVATTASGNTVTAKALTVASATAQNKLYDGTATATVTATLQTAEAFGSGNSSDGRPYTGDTLTVSAPGTFASSAVANGIAVTAGTFTLGGAAAGNYTLTQPTGLSLSANILAEAVWTQSAGGSWTNDANWQDYTIGTGTNNTADFSTLSLTADRTVTLDGARTIGNLLFNDQAGTKHAWTLNTGSGGPLTLAVTSGMPVISNNVATTLGVALAGSQGLKKTGSGTLVLNGANASLTGGVTVSQGILQLNTATSGGAGDITLNDTNTNANSVQLDLYAAVANSITVANEGSGTATIRLLAGNLITYGTGSLTLNRPLTLSAPNLTDWIQFHMPLIGSGTLTIASTGTGSGRIVLDVNSPSYTGDIIVQNAAMLEPRNFLTAASGINVTVQSGGRMQIVFLDTSIGALNGSGYVQGRLNNNETRTLTIGKGDNSGTFTGVIQNNGTSLIALTKSGTGTETLGGTNTYTGATTINNGTLAVTGSLGATAVTVNSPATLAGNGNIGGNVTIAPGAHHALAVAATTGAQVTRAIAGTLTMTDSILDLTAASAPADGTYVLATATTAITGTPATINYNGINGTVSVDAASSPQRLLLTVTSSPYGTWANGTFANGILSDKDSTHDPDGDGVTNLQEYAFGMDPTVSFSGGIVYVLDGTVSTHGQPVIFPQDNDYFTVFGRRSDYLTSGSGLTYKVQFSAGLDVWVDNDDVANAPVQVATDGTIDAIQVKYPESIVTGSGSQKPTFSRVKVTMP